MRRIGQEMKRKKDKKDVAASKQIFDSITEAADGLLGIGKTSIYAETREKLQLQLERQQSPAKPKSSPPTNSTIQWEYKLSDGTIYGPFSTAEMKQWLFSFSKVNYCRWDMGWFHGDNKVQLRQIQSTLDQNNESKIFHNVDHFSEYFV